MSYTIVNYLSDDCETLVASGRTPRDDELVLFRLLDDDGIPYYEGQATDEFMVMAALDARSESTGVTTAQVWSRDALAWEDLN